MYTMPIDSLIAHLYNEQARGVSPVSFPFCSGARYARPAGRHEAALEGRGLTSGVYVVRMRAEGFAQARRLTLLR
jgi:hypothetical protein